MKRLIPFFLFAWACGPAPEPKPEPSSQPAVPVQITVEQHADAMMAQAAAAEPTVTAMLKGLAAEAKGDMFKLKYRLKSRKSTLRKLNLKLGKKPGATPTDIIINDCLRYTMRVSDEPAGNHVSAVVRTLKSLEAKGHSVLEVKNYWPKGDNYSGINTVLKHPNGMPWELQFQTPASAAQNSASHDLYKVLRAKDTPLEKKRTVFDEMAAPWAAIKVPSKVLEEKSLHPLEKIIKRDRP